MGSSVGTFGDVGAWSFCQDKIMTTGGEGGMVTCNDPALARRMWSHKDHGKDWDAVHSEGHPPGFRFVHHGFGTNWRMLEIQGAIGRIQLGRMAQWTKRRTQNAQIIARVLKMHGDIVRTPLPAPDMQHGFYRLYAYARPEALGADWTRDRIVAALQAAGVPVMHGTCAEIYRERAFDGTDWRPTPPLPIAQELGETSIAFLVHPTIEKADAQAIADRIDHVLQTVARIAA